MIRIQIWKDKTLLHEQKISDQRQAERHIDQLITEAHAGKFGCGPLELEADRIDPDYGFYCGCFWRTTELCSNTTH